MKRFGIFFLLLAGFTFLFGCDFFGNSTTTVTTSSDEVETTTSTSTGTTSTSTTSSSAQSTTVTTTEDSEDPTLTTTTTSPVTTTTTTITTTSTTTVQTTTTTTTTHEEFPSSGVLINEIAHLFPYAIDQYEIPLAEEGMFRAYTLGDVDTYCLVYSSDMTLLFDDDDSGFTNNCMAENYLEAGTYFVLVMGYDEYEEGEYQMMVELIPQSEMTFFINDDTELVANAVDRYDFTVTQAGYLTAYTQGFTDTFGYLYDSEDYELLSGDDEGTNYNLRFDCYLQPGSYYITVEGYDETTTGDYRMIVYFTPEVASIHFESHDDVLVADGTNRYTIIITEMGYLTAYTLGDVDTYGFLMNSEDSVLQAMDDGGYDYNFKIELIVFPGTYYLEVQGYDGYEAGNYRLNIDFIPGTASDHFISDFGTIELGGGYVWHDITVTESGYIIVFTESSIDTYGYLYTDDMTLLVENDESNGYGDFLILYLVEPGVYHLKVSGYDETDQGNYQLFVDFIPLGECDFNYYYSSFGEVTAGVSGTYYVTFTQPGFVSAFTIGSTDTYGEMLDSSALSLATDDDSYLDYNFWIGLNVDPGTYTFEITGYDVDTYGSYLFVVNFVPE